MLRRLAAEVRGQAAVVETVIMLILLVAFFGGFSAYALAAHARAVVIGAASVAGRAAAIECGQGSPTWQADATYLAQQALVQGGLRLSAFQAGSPQPGTWYVDFGGNCASGSDVSTTVAYDQLDLFPFVAPLLGQGSASGWGFALTSTAIYPVE
jgi:Flp pilus assembly protein TadG